MHWTESLSTPPAYFTCFNSRASNSPNLGGYCECYGSCCQQHKMQAIALLHCCPCWREAAWLGGSPCADVFLLCSDFLTPRTRYCTHTADWDNDLGSCTTYGWWADDMATWNIDIMIGTPLPPIVLQLSPSAVLAGSRCAAHACTNTVGKALP